MMGHVPRKRFGQHFLHDPWVLSRIVDAIAPQAGDALVEIGPGEGALTRPLLARIPSLTAVEIDRDLAAALVAEFPPERLQVIVADALDYDFSALPTGLRVVGNLPYNVSTPLLFHLAAFADRVRDMHFMLQLEVVDRMAASHSTPAYGRLSVMLQRRFRIQRLFKVAPGAFRPPPKVESAVVRLTPLPAAEVVPLDERLFGTVVTRAFGARRKTLRNALISLIDAEGLSALGIDPGLRPENVSPEDYIRIAIDIARRSAPGAEIKK
ncbi:MAG: 16S rRNA (adenine(1518)-N(6)/adenine(1519)-N(6))-dimethyltransferase RsmA [Burkholderiales bacterium]